MAGALGGGGRRAQLALLGLSLLFFQITAATFTSLGVVLPAMVGELRWSWGAAGLGFTVLAVACGLASLAPAVVIRALGVRATLAAGGAVLGGRGADGKLWTTSVTSTGTVGTWKSAVGPTELVNSGPALLARGGGSIIATASISGRAITNMPTIVERNQASA